MKLTHIALACAFAIGGTAAMAQNETADKANPNRSVSAKEVGQKAKNGAKRVGQATKNGYNKARGKVREAQARNGADGRTSNSGMQSDQAQGMGADGKQRTSSTSMSGGMGDASTSRQQRIDDAYANYQSQKK